MEEQTGSILTAEGKATATGKKFSDNPLIDPMPLFGRYSSLPNRHFLKQKSQSPGPPRETLKPKLTTSLNSEVCESRLAEISCAQTLLPGTESHRDDGAACCSDAVMLDASVCSDIFHANRCHANIEQAVADFIDVDRVAGDTELTDDSGMVNRRALYNSATKMFQSRLSQRTPIFEHAERKTADNAFQRPLSDDIDLRRQSERCSMPTYDQSKSYGNIDALARQEPLPPAWLPLKHFEDSLQEFVTDSAYETSDTLKLQTYLLGKEELQSRIENINLSQDGFKINVDPESDVYHGCIHVLIDLIQTVDIRISERQPLLANDDSQTVAETGSGDKKTLPECSPVTPFYFPRNYLATVHISSETTAEQVTKEVLNKYNITNHSGRYALFEKINRKPDEGHSDESSSTVYLRKLAAKERPLELCLHSVDENMDAFEKRQFLLRENDKGDVLWEAFSLPELNMFLDILLWEEESYVKAIHQKYASLRTTLEEKLDLERRQNYDFLSRIQSPKNKLFEQGDE